MGDVGGRGRMGVREGGKVRYRERRGGHGQVIMGGGGREGGRGGEEGRE